MLGKRIISWAKSAATQGKLERKQRFLLPAALGIAFTALISLPSSASAATWYVSPISSPAAQANSLRRAAAAAQNQAAMDQYFSNLCKQFASELSAAGDPGLANLLNEYATWYSQEAAQETAIANNDLQQANQLTAESNGTSWQTAWADLSSINWSQVQSGDHIELDTGAGGQAGLITVYQTPLNIGKDGVTVEVSNQAGHNGGIAVINPQGAPACINIGSHQNVTVQGSAWGQYNFSTPRSPNLVAFGYRKVGIVVSSCPAGWDNVNLKNIEVIQCTTGLQIAGSPNCNQLLVHDNLLDVDIATPMGGYAPNFNHCFIGNVWGGPGWASGSPTDGVHIDAAYQGGFSWYSFYNCIFGPGLSTSIVFGQPNSGLNVNNSLFMNPQVSGIRKTASNPYYAMISLNHVTSFLTPLNAQGQGHDCLTFAEGQDQCFNGIFYGGNVNVQGSRPLYFGTLANDQFRTAANTVVLGPTMQDPMFVSPVGSYPNNVSASILMNTNFALQGGSPANGKGSSMTSVQQFLSTLQ